MQTTPSRAIPPFDRRRQRSDDPIVALHHQLASARRLASAEALVLVDDAGALIAGVGAWPICEELAAFAPLLARAERDSRGSERLASLSPETETLAFEIAGSEVVLSARGARGECDAALRLAADGARRILAA
jgi:hypothetical protein